MDSLTQAALGASLAGAVAGKTLGRSVLLTGAVLGTLPDLDVVIDYGTAVANFTQHRGFSHSLFVLAPLAVALAWLLWRWKPQLSFQRWLALTGLILITHDMGVVAETADRVLVQYAGRIMECSDVIDIFENPQSGYTRALLSALPESATGDRLPVVSDWR